MATSKGRGGAASKSAPKKATKSAGNAGSKSAGNKKGAASKGSSSSSGAGAKKVAAKKSTATKATASKKSAPSKAAASRGGGSTVGRGKAVASGSARNGSASASAASRGRATSGAAASRSSASARSGARGSSKASADPRNDLEKILQDLMKDIYYAEKKLTKALGKMARNATDGKLKQAFLTHQSQTEDQVAKLEKAFDTIGAKAKAKKCAAMDGLLEEADEHIEEYEKGAGLDAALIVGAQKVEHYEIAAYGSMRSIAQTLGYDKAARIFEEIREQESDTDELLTQIAESVVNLQAEGETEDVKGGGKSSSSSKGKGGSDRSGSEDSDAGEDSSSASSGKSGGGDDDNDGAGRGISGMTDGNDRGEASETGAAMGH